MTDVNLYNFKEVIAENYHYRLFVDNLPSATKIRDPETGVEHKDYQSGIPVGKLVYDETGTFFKYILYNHWNIVITTAPVEDSLHHRILGFDVEPRSYAQGELRHWDYKGHKPLYVDDLLNLPLDQRDFSFTYNIRT